MKIHTERASQTEFVKLFLIFYYFSGLKILSFNDCGTLEDLTSLQRI